MRQIPDQASGLTQLLSGELDFLPQIAPADAPRVKASPRLELISYWFNVYVAVGLEQRAARSSGTPRCGGP